MKTKHTLTQAKTYMLITNENRQTLFFSLNDAKDRLITRKKIKDSVSKRSSHWAESMENCAMVWQIWQSSR